MQRKQEKKWQMIKVKKLLPEFGGNRKVRSTKAYSPWDIVYVEEFASKLGAYKRELKIKSYKGGEAFKKLIK